MIPLLPDTGNIESAWAIFFLVLAGFLGALVKELLSGGLKLPFVNEGTLNLGFISSLLIGSIAGYYLGDSIVGSFNAGLTASAILTAIIAPKV